MQLLGVHHAEIHKKHQEISFLISTLVTMAVTSAVSQSVSPAAPKRSWADIVKGRSEAKVEPLRPAAFGSHRCLCTGEFLVMLGHYGWIMALQDIDHPDADRHGGRIYLRASDLRPGASPKEGDEVTFFLYSDENGLGAEDCYATSEPHPPQPPPVKKQVLSRPKINKRAPPQHADPKKTLNADAHEFVPIVLVAVDAGEDDNSSVTMNPDAKEFVPPPPGLGPILNAEAAEFVPCPPLASRRGFDMCVINTKRFHDDDDSSDDGTDSTTSDVSGRVLVAPGLSTCFVSKEGKPAEWSSLASRCAQAVGDADMDSDSWCDDDSDDSDDDSYYSPQMNRAEEWAAVSARCAEAVGKVEHEHSWHVRNAAAAAKLRADVGNDIRWDVVLDALAELDAAQANHPLVADDSNRSAAIAFITSRPPPGFA